jgi:hypothetical protein
MKKGEIHGECSMHGEMKNAYKIVIIKTVRKRPLKTSRCRWEDNIKVDLKDVSHQKL